jgi:hypothetical protein
MGNSESEYRGGADVVLAMLNPLAVEVANNSQSKKLQGESDEPEASYSAIRTPWGHPALGSMHTLADRQSVLRSVNMPRGRCGADGCVVAVMQIIMTQN